MKINSIQKRPGDFIEIFFDDTWTTDSILGRMKKRSTSDYKSEPSGDIRQKVNNARQRQEERFKKYHNIHSNAKMPSRMVRSLCELDDSCKAFLKTAMNKLQLSARAYDRILKVARTCADLGGSEKIKVEYLAEAIQYRGLDREGWAG